MTQRCSNYHGGLETGSADLEPHGRMGPFGELNGSAKGHFQFANGLSIISISTESKLSGKSFIACHRTKHHSDSRFRGRNKCFRKCKRGEISSVSALSFTKRIIII